MKHRMLLKFLRFCENLFFEIGSKFEDWADGIDVEFHEALRKLADEAIEDYRNGNTIPLDQVLMKRYKFELTVNSGNNEFWETKPTDDEVKEALRICLASHGFYDGENVVLNLAHVDSDTIEEMFEGLME